MIVEILWDVIFSFLAIGFISAFIRLAKGPHLPDRIISLDLISIMAIGFSWHMLFFMINPVFWMSPSSWQLLHS